MYFMPVFGLQNNLCESHNTPIQIQKAVFFLQKLVINPDFKDLCMIYKYKFCKLN